MHKHLFAALVVLAVCLRAAGPASLEDLSWIAGHWRGEVAGSVIEEHWTLPSGDSMMGMFRVMRDGKARLFEFMTIEKSADGPVLRLKHFTPGLVGREEKDQAVTAPLVSYRKGEAVFESTDKQRPTQFTFRKESENSLTIVLERERDGRKMTDAYRYSRSQ